MKNHPTESMKKSTIYSSKPYIVAPLFGLIAGWLIDRYSPRKMMLAGSLMTGDLFGVKTLGRVMGIILVTDGRKESLSPMMVCALGNDALKSYSPGFIVLICIAMFGALIVSFLQKSGEKTDEIDLIK